ncbi:MAG: hypothetical protein JOZ10_06650 [Acidobacteria bacterium]|nr:hypothetical protein [Acidobacteriota bacterium]
MKRVALATSCEYWNLTEDDRLLIPALRALDIEAVAAVWDTSTVDWTSFDGVIVRSCWDYHLRLAEFLAWIARLECLGVPIQNSPLVLRWNADKRYLRQLEAFGTILPPTSWISEDEQVNIGDILAERGWERAVIKPAVSATAYNTRCVDRSEADELVRGPLLIQQFVPEVRTAGEWSMIFIGGQFSHAVRKYPKQGDFRVQAEFGGREEPATAGSALVAAAAKILDQAEHTLYARVDGVEQHGQFLLMELELIEPVLFLALGDAAVRLARAIQKWVDDCG